MTESALAVARHAPAAARAALPAYPSKSAKRTYTRHRLVALLAVRQSLRTDYRGPDQHLRDWSDLRAAVGLGGRVPDHSTLQKAAARLLGEKAPATC